jgi:hypothetical protein
MFPGFLKWIVERILLQPCTIFSAWILSSMLIEYHERNRTRTMLSELRAIKARVNNTIHVSSSFSGYKKRKLRGYPYREIDFQNIRVNLFSEWFKDLLYCPGWYPRTNILCLIPLYYVHWISCKQSMFHPIFRFIKENVERISVSGNEWHIGKSRLWDIRVNTFLGRFKALYIAPGWYTCTNIYCLIPLFHFYSDLNRTRTMLSELRAWITQSMFILFFRVLKRESWEDIRIGKWVTYWEIVLSDIRVNIFLGWFKALYIVPGNILALIFSAWFLSSIFIKTWIEREPCYLNCAP